MQQCADRVALVKSILTTTYLQNSASIQPRTSLSKFGGDSIYLFIRLLTLCYPKVPDAKVHKAVSKVRAARGIFTPVGYLSAFFLAYHLERIQTPSFVAFFSASFA